MPTKMFAPMKRGELLCAVALVIFLISHSVAIAISFACSCALCAAGGFCGSAVPLESSTSTAFQSASATAPSTFFTASPWNFTATDGSRSTAPGNPVTLTWGFVNDGTSVNDSGNPGGANVLPSSLISTLNNTFGSSTTGSVQQAPWFSLFEETFGRWAELSGVTYNFESADNGAILANGQRGRLGQIADVRIGGRPITRDEGNVLAFNFFPSVGDMIIDTDDFTPGLFNNPFDNFRAFRNTIAHEIGHGLGIRHLESSDSVQLLEPTLTLAVDGPQIAEILAVHRLYGDARESGGGNDTAATADAIGAFGVGDSFALGTDGDTLVVTSDQTDFVSIDGTSDTDLYRFTVDEMLLADLDLTQVGRSFMVGAEGSSSQTLVDNSVRNELRLELLTLDDTGVLTTEATATPLGDGVSRSIEDFVLLPGEDYFLQVTGTVDEVQLYEIGLSFLTAVPEPSSGVLALLSLVAGVSRRRAA